MSELDQYERIRIKRRLKTMSRKLESYQTYIDGLIKVLLESGHEGKAQDFAILYHSLAIIRDLIEKLYDSI